MSRQTVLKEALELTPEERIELAMEIWESVADEANQMPVSDALKSELDRRRTNHEANPSAAMPWPEFREQLRRRT